MCLERSGRGNGTFEGVSALGEKRNDGDTGVSSDDGNVLFLGIGVFQFGNKSRGPDNIQSGNSKQSTINP